MRLAHPISLLILSAVLAGCSAKESLQEFAVQVRDGVVAHDIRVRQYNSNRREVTYDDRPGVAPRPTPGQSPVPEAEPKEAGQPQNTKPTPPVIFYMPPVPTESAPPSQ